MSRIAFFAVLMFATGTGARAQACNPMIDGTYCAEVPTRNAPASAPAGRSAPIGLGSALSSGSYEQPAKLGTITFGGGSSCIGLLRRVNCN
jgi:hypothetical protein